MKHIAIIMDGNGRWAKAQGKDRKYGHDVGMNKIKDACLWAIENNIKYMTLFCFSTENWKRPSDEVKFLYSKFESFIESQLDFLDENLISIKWIGRKTKVKKNVKEKLLEAEQKTNFQFKLRLNLCIDYGSFEELKSAIKIIIEKYKSSGDFEKKFNELDILKYLYTNDSPEIDLLIRPGKEKRLSNFMLLQSSYAELYFCDKYWPEFEKEDFETAIEDYNNRKRRYGGLKNNE